MEKQEGKGRKIIRGTALGLITLCILAEGTLYIYDKNVNHFAEYCKLNKLFGAKHQITVINKEGSKDGISARLESGRAILKDIIEPLKTDNEDGTITYSAPANYMLEGDKAVKTVIYESASDSIVLSKVDPETGKKFDYSVIPVLRKGSK